MLEPSLGTALAEAAAAGWGVIVKEAVANGRLTDRTTDPHVSQSVGAIAKAHGVGIDAVAIGAVLAQPWVSVVLSGAATPDQLAGNLTASSVELAPEDLESLAELAEEPAAYWATRSALAWT